MTKVVIPTAKKGPRKFKAVIPLERPTQPELKKGDYHTFKLRVSPDEDNSAIYELSIPKFSTGTPEEWFKFLDNVRTALPGMKMTTGPQQFQFIRQLLKGEALSAFNAKATSVLTSRTAGGAARVETVERFEEVLRLVTKHASRRDLCAASSGSLANGLLETGSLG